MSSFGLSSVNGASAARDTWNAMLQAWLPGYMQSPVYAVSLQAAYELMSTWQSCSTKASQNLRAAA